ncbi:MAG TPA: glycosyltransferase family 4 protein [Streptosporangiaceae bacterium]|nr:glycosyltransferase family 4 protein [Streptosporangiaceae bacterium]
MLARAGSTATPSGEPVLLTVPGKCADGPQFWRYVAGLTCALSAAITPPGGAVAHLQHLAFGASPALIGAFPQLRRIALVHGTDLLAAETSQTQLHVLHRVIAAASAIVVPTAAMADRLRCLAPHLPAGRLIHIPWGIPDHLLSAVPPRNPGADGSLRLLYAGRLTAEKGTAELIAACAAISGIRLSVAAPEEQRAAIQRAPHAPGRAGLSPCWLGWLPRPSLWAVFADHDLLVVPSTTLEAFGLVAVEAQACGLPVLYQPVPGLTEVLGDSAATADFTSPGELAAVLRWLAADPTAIAHLRTAGLANAARFPLSRTAAQLADLTSRLA